MTKWYCKIYDVFYDQIGEWLEDTKCDDPECEFCVHRPDKHPYDCACDKEMMVNKHDNPVWVDVWKFYMAIECDTCQNGMYSQDYILEKLRQILEGNTNWHHKINEAWEKQKNEMDSR